MMVGAYELLETVLPQVIISAPRFCLESIPIKLLLVGISMRSRGNIKRRLEFQVVWYLLLDVKNMRLIGERAGNYRFIGQCESLE